MWDQSGKNIPRYDPVIGARKYKAGYFVTVIYRSVGVNLTGSPTLPRKGESAASRLMRSNIIFGRFVQITGALTQAAVNLVNRKSLS